MNEFRIRTTGQVVTELEFRAMHDVVFPAVLDTTTLEEYGADPVLVAPSPLIDEMQAAYRNGVVLDALGNWVHAWVIVPLSAAEIQARKPKEADYIQALEAMFDAKAAERRYASRMTCTARAGYAGPFQAEATAFAIWMDTCNMTAYGVMAQVIGGTRAQPTVAELLALMPALTWPAQVY